MAQRTVNLGNPVNYSHPLNASKFWWGIAGLSDHKNFCNLCNRSDASLLATAPDAKMTIVGSPSFAPFDSIQARPTTLGSRVSTYQPNTGGNEWSIPLGTLANWTTVAGGTIFMWIRGITTDTVCHLLGPSGSAQHYGFSGNTLDYFSWLDTSRYVSAFSDTFDRSVWHTLGFSIKAGANNCRVFRNGVLLTTGTLNAANPSFFRTGGNYLQSNQGGGMFYPGGLDDFQCWARALDDQEMAQVDRESRLDYPSMLNWTVQRSYFVKSSGGGGSQPPKPSRGGPKRAPKSAGVTFLGGI